MWKYLGAVVLLFGLAIYVSVQDKRAAEQHTKKATQRGNNVASAKTDENYTEENVADSEWNLPSWYGFFRWPNGVTVWAILLTLLAIAEQTKQTAKMVGPAARSAEAALLNAKAIIHSERPWVMVQVTTLPGENSAKSLFQISIFNYGKSPAHIVSCKGPIAEYRALADELPIPPNYGVWEWDKRFLAPNDSTPLRQSINPTQIKKEMAIKSLEDGTVMPEGQVVVYGLVEYTDGITDAPYRTAYSYRLQRVALSDMGGKLVIAGPRVYNEYS